MGLKLMLAILSLTLVGCCEPTYMGLKRGRAQRAFRSFYRLRAYLYGIETDLAIVGDRFRPKGCEPTYMGLKRIMTGLILICLIRLRAYLYGIETKISDIMKRYQASLRAYLYGIETFSELRAHLAH